jgi:hypothetical protein
MFNPIEIVNLASPDKAQHRCEETTSEAYSFIPTEEISAALLQRGWGVSKVVTTKPKQGGRIGFQKHMVRYRRLGDEQIAIGDSIAELLLVNAHDGTTSYQFRSGLFRLICSNGMIVSEQEFKGVRVVHLGATLPSIIDASMEVADRLPTLAHQVNMMRAIGMTSTEREDFALQAIDMRYGIDSKIPAEIVLKPRRQEDAAPTLWNTLNVVQENIMHGGMYAPHRAGGWQPLKPVKGMALDLKVNEKLWDIAAGMIR